MQEIARFLKPMIKTNVSVPWLNKIGGSASMTNWLYFIEIRKNYHSIILSLNMYYIAQCMQL